MYNLLNHLRSSAALMAALDDGSSAGGGSGGVAAAGAARKVRRSPPDLPMLKQVRIGSVLALRHAASSQSIRCLQVLAIASSLCKPPDSANKDEDPEQTELTAEVKPQRLSHE